MNIWNLEGTLVKLWEPRDIYIALIQANNVLQIMSPFYRTHKEAAEDAERFTIAINGKPPDNIYIVHVKLPPPTSNQQPEKEG